MKSIFSLILTAGILLAACQGDKSSSGALRFNDDGRFKIVQFTDVHYQLDLPGSDSALRIMQTVIQKEKPDLVVLTGDIVCCNDTKKGWDRVAGILIKAEVPWAVTLGNHDSEFELTREQIIDYVSGMPYNLAVRGPENISGSGNYTLEIKSASSDITKAVLYFLDSHSYPSDRKYFGSYDWIKFDQIQWYLGKSKEYSKANNNQPLPALAFFHIPLPEYRDIIYNENTFGVQEELICAPNINSGMYAALLTSGDVMGTFVGHDHNNNYIGILRDVCMAYGAVTGLDCYGKIGRGARIIELCEGERKFDTWLYYHDNPKKYHVTYPDSFMLN